MNVATNQQVNEYMLRALNKGLNLIEVKNQAISAGWTISLSGEKLKLGSSKSIVYLANNPDKIQRGVESSAEPLDL